MDKLNTGELARWDQSLTTITADLDEIIGALRRRFTAAELSETAQPVLETGVGPIMSTLRRQELAALVALAAVRLATLPEPLEGGE